MNTNQAIELAQKHAKLRPESYYSEPFIPHDWVVAAIVEASTPKIYTSLNEDLTKLLDPVMESPCEALLDNALLHEIHEKIAELQGKISRLALEELSRNSQELNLSYNLDWPFPKKKR